MSSDDQLYPIFEILDRVLRSGHSIYIKRQPDEIWLYDSIGDGIVSGKTFRELCINIVMAGL